MAQLARLFLLFLIAFLIIRHTGVQGAKNETGQIGKTHREMANHLIRHLLPYDLYEWAAAWKMVAAKVPKPKTAKAPKPKTAKAPKPKTAKAPKPKTVKPLVKALGSKNTTEVKSTRPFFKYCGTETFQGREYKILCLSA